MKREKIADEELRRYRTLDSAQVLRLLAEYAKQDSNFLPVKNDHTQRWHVVVAGQHHEILTTGPKWFDARAERGGGGAIDLAIYLFRTDFKGAVRRLRDVGA